MKTLVVMQKPFTAVAKRGIEEIIENAGNEVQFLEKYDDTKALIEAVKDADALIVRSDKIGPEVFAAAKNLKIVVRAGAGYDNIDLNVADAARVVVENTPGQNANAVAELALALMLYMSRGQMTPRAGMEISGKKLGIQAFGAVGSLVGRKADALGMKVQAFDPYVSDERLADFGVKRSQTLEQMYSECDFISIHIPSTPQTRRSIGYDLMRKMPFSATLVNTARKEVIDEDGLFRVLQERPDLKYVADVAPDNYDTLKRLFPDRIFATPAKMGAQTAEANLNAALAAARQINDYFATGSTAYQVNHFSPES